MSETNAPKWGLAHPKRGSADQETAIAFITSHPIGTEMNADKLEIIGRALFSIPEGKYTPASYFKDRLTNAGSHPRMRPRHQFVIQYDGNGSYTVRSNIEAFTNQHAVIKAQNKIQSQLKIAKTYLQGLPWPELNRDLQIQVANAYDRLEGYLELCELQGQRVERNLAQLNDSLAAALTDRDATPELTDGGDESFDASALDPQS